MIKVKNMSYSFPQKELYEKISFSIEKYQHCALIGSNGTGKSVLVDMIMNSEEYLFDGSLKISENCRIGYISQFYKVDKTKNITVFDYISQDFVKTQEKIDTICTQMETSEDIESLLEQYQTTFDEFQAMDGDHYVSNIKKQLKTADLLKQENLPISKLSGGEWKLVQVIKEMITSPNLLIMDEPDVFLDFQHLNSLKDLINTHKGTILVITHNRYLLNHCFKKILHLEDKQLQEFEGTYIEYNLYLLKRKIELQELAYADSVEIERNRKVVEKLRAEATAYISSTKGSTLHARVSMLERLEARRRKEPFVDIKQPEIFFNTTIQIDEQPVLTVTDYNLAFEHNILEHVNFSIQASEKIAIVGENGTGKTTLLRDIFLQTLPSITIHPDVVKNYLTQTQDEVLNESNTLLEEFYKIGFDSNEEIKKYLSHFNFPEEVINRKIEHLSGGEKNIFQLAKISAQNANLLLLDEPTNHLDIYAQIALEKAIHEYNGAIVMVSHDFYTIANSMDYVLLIEDKTIRKVSIRKFRKMIYEKHFDKDYLEHEQKKKELEVKIALMLNEEDFESAKGLTEQLEKMIKK